MKQKRTCVLAIFVIVFLSVSILSFAQDSNTTITGKVFDPQHRAVAAASVTLSGPGLTAPVTTQTDATGAFSLRQVAPGHYELKIESPGFDPAESEVHVSSSAAVQLNISLRLARVDEVLEVKAGQSVQVDTLDVSEVRESSARDVGEALAKVDGVAKIRKAGIANDIVVRGFQQNNVNVAIDGARIYGACPGHMDPAVQHVDFAEVEKVEVVKGAFDVRNQGSLGAAVNVTTRRPSNGFHVKPSFSTGSYGYVNPSATVSYGNDSFRVLGGYSYRSSDPYIDGSGRKFTDYAAYKPSTLSKEAFDFNTGWMQLGFSPAEGQDLVLSYTRQQGGLVLYPYLTMDADYDNADRLGFKYSAREMSGHIRGIRAEAYLTNVIHFMSDSQRTSSGTQPWTMASHASTRTIGGRAEIDFGRDLTVGYESYARNWNVLGYMKMSGMSGMSMGMAAPVSLTTNASVPDVNTTINGVFADYHRSITDRLRLSAGARFDFSSMSAQTGAATDLYYIFQNTRSLSATDKYPSGNARLSYAIPKAGEFFVGIGSTARVPDAEERFIGRGGSVANVGDPSLPIVRNTEYTAGLNLKHGGAYFKPVLFYSDVRDYIVINNQPRVNAIPSGWKGMPPSMTARSYANDDARIYGGEIGYGTPLTQKLSWSGGTAYTRGVKDRNPARGINSSEIAEMAPLRSWVALRFAHRYFFTEVEGVGVARQTHVDRDVQETATAGYGTMNFKLGANFRKMYATFTVDNMLDKYYYEHLSYYRDPFRSGVRVPEPGRNFFVQVAYTF